LVYKEFPRLLFYLDYELKEEIDWIKQIVVFLVVINYPLLPEVDFIHFLKELHE